MSSAIVMLAGMYIAAFATLEPCDRLFERVLPVGLGLVTFYVGFAALIGWPV